MHVIRLNEKYFPQEISSLKSRICWILAQAHLCLGEFSAEDAWAGLGAQHHCEGSAVLK